MWQGIVCSSQHLCCYRICRVAHIKASLPVVFSIQAQTLTLTLILMKLRSSIPGLRGFWLWVRGGTSPLRQPPLPPRDTPKPLFVMGSAPEILEVSRVPALYLGEQSAATQIIGVNCTVMYPLTVHSNTVFGWKPFSMVRTCVHSRLALQGHQVFIWW